MKYGRLIAIFLAVVIVGSVAAQGSSAHLKFPNGHWAISGLTFSDTTKESPTDPITLVFSGPGGHGNTNAFDMVNRF